jgi:hypothetical protein
MEQLSEDWEILSCKVHYTWANTLATLLASLVGGLVGGGLPDSIHESATWTVRQKSSGLVKWVTARDKSEAAEFVSKGLFDPDHSDPR